MFTREVNWSLADALVACEERVLSHTPAGVAPTQEWITRGIAQCSNSSVVGADAWKDLLQALKRVMRILLYHLRIPGRRVGRRRSVGGSNRATRVIDENAHRACLTKRGIPEYLNIQVGKDETTVVTRPGTILVPVTSIELQKEFGDGTVSKLSNGSLLQGIKS